MSFLSREEFNQLANADLDKLYDYLTEKFNALEVKIEKQIQVIQVQDSRIKELEARLNQNSKNSHKPPSSDIFKKERDRKTSRRKSGGQTGHEGSNLKMVSNPTDTKEYPAPENCEKCNQSLIEIQGKSNVGQEFTLPKMEMSIIEHRVESKKCSCGHTNISSNAPVIKNHAFYGTEFKSFIIYLKNHHMLPFARIKELIKDVFGHTVSEGTIWNCEKEISKKLLPIEDTIKQEIIDGNVACFDETGTRSEKKNFWVHVAVNPDFSHFSFHNKRGFDGMIAGGILPNFKGTAVHDFFKPYLKFNCKHSFCNAHLLRELIGAHETTKQVWTEMMLGVLITGLDARKESNSETASMDILKMYDKAILMGFQENPDIDIGKRKSSSKVINLLKRMDRNKEDILKFLFITDVPFDNNLAERALRMLKVKNKISGCFRNSQSGDFFCRLRSFIDTCKKQKLAILDSITVVFKTGNFQFMR
jgi:transposase